MPVSDSDFTFDVFISYSHADAEWVSEWLVTRLRGAGFRVCVDYDSFDLGAPSIRNMERAVEQSRHVLLVLTPNWTESEWADFEALLVQTGDPSAQRRRVLPLMLKACKPRKSIAMLTHADFTDPARWDEQFERLCDAISGRTNFRAAFKVPGAAAADGAPFVLPQRDVETFSGRGEELARLEELLLRREGEKVCGIVGLAGAGGIGKSALAGHFAELHREKFPDGVIGLRVDNKDLDALAREFARWAGEEFEPEDERDAATIMQEVFGHRRALLVFDNADDASVAKLRPGGELCAVIVTTRDRQLPFLLGIPEEGRIELSPLARDEALLLLGKLLGEARTAPEAPAAGEIIELVGRLPLALQIVGAALQMQPWRALENYADSLREERERLSRLQIRGAAHLDVRASFSLSLRLLKEEEVDFFACLGVCAQDGFSVRAAMAAAGCDEAEAHERLGYLFRLSLLNLHQSGEGRFVFHPLLRVFARELSDQRSLHEAAAERHALHYVNLVKSGHEADASLLAAELDDIILAARWLQSHDHADYNFAFSLTPFLQSHGYWQQAVDLMAGFLHLAERMEDSNAIVQLRIQQAKFLSLNGQWTRAEEALAPVERILDRIEPPYVRQHFEAMWLNTLGGLQQRAGRLTEAAATLKRSADIEEQLGNIRGEAKALNSLGGILQRLGKFDEALGVLRRSAMIEQQLGNEHGQAMVLNSLGGVLQRQGNFDEALTAFRRSLNLSTTLGDLRGQAMVLNSLGTVLQRQGHFEEAADTLRQSIAVEEKIKNQRGLAMALNSLGGVLQRTGRLDEALDACQRSYRLLVEQKDLMGQAMALNSLGGVLQRTGRFDEALGAFRRSLAISEGLKDERSVAMALNSLGGVLQRTGRFDEALDAFSRCLAISEGLKDERSVAMALNSLGGVLQRTGRFDEALTVLERSLHISEQLDDKVTLSQVLNSLGGVLQRTGRFDEALGAFRRRLAISEGLDDKRSVAMALNSLGGVLQRMGRLDEALGAFTRSCAVAEESKDQQSLAMRLNSLGGVLLRMGRLDEAVDVFRRSYGLLVEQKDLRGQAMVLNSLGGVLAKVGSCDEAWGAFRGSIKIGERLNDRRHLAIVHTAFGRSLLERGDTEKAAAELGAGFAIEEGFKSGRGLCIVTPLLVRALERLGRHEEALEFCRRASAAAPGEGELKRLYDERVSRPGGPADGGARVSGKVKVVIRHERGYRYGFVEAEDGGPDIYFREGVINSQCVDGLAKGVRVEVEAEPAPQGKRRAKSIRVIADGAGG